MRETKINVYLWFMILFVSLLTYLINYKASFLTWIFRILFILTCIFSIKFWIKLDKIYSITFLNLKEEKKEDKNKEIEEEKIINILERFGKDNKKSSENGGNTN